MHLNYLPLRFTSDVFCGGLLKFEGDPKLLAGKESELSLKLRALRGKHNGTHVFHASGNSIACIQLKPDAAPIGEPTQFDIVSDFQLANALARAALFEFFRSSNETVTRFRPVTVLLEKHNLASRRKDVFGFIPEYTLDVRPLAPHEGEISSGVLITFGVRHIFLKTAAELVAEGVSLRGLYAVAVSEDGDIQTPLERRYLGRIEDVRGDIAIFPTPTLPNFLWRSASPKAAGSTWRPSEERCSATTTTHFRPIYLIKRSRSWAPPSKWIASTSLASGWKVNRHCHVPRG